MSGHSTLYYFLTWKMGRLICLVRGHKYTDWSELNYHARTGCWIETRYVYCERHIG